MRLNQALEIGGVNSINNFARSWQRAAGFHEVAPLRPALVLAPDNDEQWIESVSPGAHIAPLCAVLAPAHPGGTQPIGLRLGGEMARKQGGPALSAKRAKWRGT